jgi:hypothetical protein
LFKYSKLGFTLSLLLAVSMWFYVQNVLIGHQEVDAELHAVPRGNLSDLYPRWLGARELLLHHRDPYSAEVTREIQTGYYGRPLDPTRASDPKDQQGFAYPVYVVFFLAPTIGFPFADVQAGFRWFLLTLILATVPLWLRAMRWRSSFTTTAILIVLTLGSFPVLQGIKLQQLSLLVAGLIAICAVALTDNYFALAGILLALATVKPQLIFPLILWLLLWAFSDWRRRQNLVWGFAATMTVLCAAAEYVLPGWLWRFRDAISAYKQYNDGAGSVLDVLVTPQWGRVLAVLSVLALAAIGWRFRRTSHDSPAFHFVLVLVLAVTVVIVPKAAPYNQVLLVPGILLVVRDLRMLWQKSRLTRMVLVASSLIVSWPWMAATGLVLASLFLPTRLVQQAWAVPVWTSLVIPLCVTLLLVCGYNDFAHAKPTY